MPDVSIAMLAGGMSRRLGTDKALLRLAGGGPTLLQRAISACAGLSNDRFIVAPADRGYAESGLRVVADRYPGEGPAGGVISALAAARHDYCLVLGCDYPFLATPLLRWLIELADPERPVIPQLPHAGRQGRNLTLEVLHGIYPSSALPVLEAVFNGGERQLASFALALEPRLVPLESLLRFDPGLRSFRSINRPEDAAWARQELVRLRAGNPIRHA
jgi:molybdopterin-guanine dinucleotide biosynthesis protein A